MHQSKPSILKLNRYGDWVDVPAVSARVKAITGKGSFRQSAEILRFMFGPQRMQVPDYYQYGLWRTELSACEGAAFLSEAGSTALNLRLSPLNRMCLHGLMTNKLLTGLTLRSAGLPAQRPRAVFGVGLAIPGSDWLTSASEISAWLRRDGSLPVFGKPAHSSLCIGVASYLALTDQGQSVLLGDGRTVSVDAVATEIATYFARGYLFEPLIQQHADVEAFIGPAVGALRVVTLREPEGIRVLYVAQRLPAVGAMTDGAQLNAPFSEAQIDCNTGRIIRVQDMDQLPPDHLTVSNTTGKAFGDVVLSFFKESLQIARDAHSLFAEAGILGFDIALSKDGPLINEINSNPHHSIYQRSGDRGLMNPDLRPRLEVALALAKVRSRSS